MKAISSIIKNQEKLYRESLKLIVSENRLSPAVGAALCDASVWIASL